MDSSPLISAIYRIMWMSSHKKFWLFLSIAFLAAGFVLYSLLRPFPWMPWSIAFHKAPLFLHHHLLNALWMASFSSFLLFLRRKTAIRKRHSGGPFSPVPPGGLTGPHDLAGADVVDVISASGDAIAFYNHDFFLNTHIKKPATNSIIIQTIR